MDNRHLGWILRWYPADYRDSHGEEIATTLADAQGEGVHRIGLLDVAALLVAGVRIRVRSLSTHEAYDSVRRGTGLGIRLALFAQASVATALLWSSSIEGHSIYSRLGTYPLPDRLLMAAMFAPWIAVFVSQLFGWWRTALAFAAVSVAAGSALLYYKVAVSPFGYGPTFVMAIYILLAGTVLVAAGKRHLSTPVRYPWLTLVSWGTVVWLYSSSVRGMDYVLAPLAVGGLAFVLIAIGMAISGNPRGLAACVVLAFPATLVMVAGATPFPYVGFIVGDMAFGVFWVIAACVVSAAVFAVAVLASRSIGRSDRRLRITNAG